MAREPLTDSAIAALLMLGTEPSDRALTGWCVWHGSCQHNLKREIANADRNRGGANV